MKKILSILILVSGLIACENQEISFPDFDYTAAYFPYQYPVRTLVLGEYIFPNENDNNHKFEIAAAFGGAYENTDDKIVSFELSPELCINATWPNGQPILPLPESYYSLSSANQITIPAGSTNGRLEVQLTDAFFDDPKTIANNYVIPVRITGVTNLDSILRGKPAVVNPDPRKPGDWAILPKDFTMFCIKYINPYHGKYLHRGTSVVKDASNATLETTRYAAAFAEKNEIWSLVTTGKNEVTVTGSLRSAVVTGQLKMKLNFLDNGSCTITENTGSAYAITGSGAYVKKAESWGGKDRDAIFISYQVSSGGNTYFATDTLAMRDRGVALEVYQPVVSGK
jgi:hypothetical protein